MDLTPHLDAIRSDLESMVGVDEQIGEAMERMAEAALQLRLLEVLGEGALELTEQLPAGQAEVRVSGRDARLVYSGPPEQPPPAPLADDEGGTARVTLRMPDALKGAVEEAADAAGVSVNTWLVQAAQSALGSSSEQRRRPAANRISGYARS